WVEGMYEDLLGRGADDAGLRYWTGQLAAGADPAAVAFGFAASAEREGIRIGGDYQAFLARTLDPGGQTFWVDRFLHGASNEDVVGGCVAAPESYNSPDKGQGSITAWVRSALEDVFHRAVRDPDLVFRTIFLGSCSRREEEAL